MSRFLLVLALLLLPFAATAREQRTIDGAWRSSLFVTNDQGQTPGADGDYQAPRFDDRLWKNVEVPHNWQGYSYNRQVVRGTLHGVAWYRKTIDLPRAGADERLFLMFVHGFDSFKLAMYR